MTALFLLASVGTLVGVFAWLTRDRDGRRTRSLLRRRYLELSPLQPRAAEMELLNGLQLMRSEHPGRSDVWHLKRLIAALH